MMAYGEEKCANLAKEVANDTRGGEIRGREVWKIGTRTSYTPRT
jgi:hypothetical protein